MKDGLGAPAIARLAANLKRADTSFDAAAFARSCRRGLSELELRQRVDHVITCLHEHLPQGFPKAARLLQDAVPGWDGGDPKDSLRGFASWPAIDYVGCYGLDHFDLAMETLRRMTGLFTAEFAIRPFIAKDAERALTTIASWLSDEDWQVRRLCSEGLRPNLPWGKRVAFLSSHPERIITILDQLWQDPSEDVRRSVANNLNDIAKNHPELVLDTCEKWLAESEDELKANTEKLVRHATRTLVKSGHQRALAFQGVRGKAKLDVAGFELKPKRLQLGSTLALSAQLTSTAKTSQQLVIDFVIHHQGKTGNARPKVFKWKTCQLPPGQSLELTKNHPVKPITTRRYYPGKHVVELIVNGQVVAEAAFTLSIHRS